MKSPPAEVPDKSAPIAQPEPPAGEDDTSNPTPAPVETETASVETGAETAAEPAAVENAPTPSEGRHLDLSQSDASVTARALAKLEEAKQQHETHAAAIEELSLAKEEVGEGSRLNCQRVFADVVL